MDFIPEKSELQIDNIEFKDRIVRNMLKDIGLKKLFERKSRD